MMRYLPSTAADRQAMLAAIGVADVQALFAEIPAALRTQGELALPAPLAEAALLAHLQALAKENVSLAQVVSFLGAGVYDHWIPSVVPYVASRTEFVTSYTPYQAELNQGTLQATFEFQTLLCQLTGLDVANASLYDGGTAVVEAARMAMAATGRTHLLLTAGLHPETRQILTTFAHGFGATLEEVPSSAGVTSIAACQKCLGKHVAALLMQSPSFWGTVEDVAALAEIVDAVGALPILSVHPLTLGLLRPPGETKVAIAVGDLQPLGLPASFGGPHGGFMAARQSLLRRLPGRIVGETVDAVGRRGFVLTLQAREQHIRREKATSNLCSNQALHALTAAVYLATLGKQGLVEVAQRMYDKAHYLQQQLIALPGVQASFAAPFFHEFAITLPRPAAAVIDALIPRGYLAGYDLGRSDAACAAQLLVAVTELRTKAEMDGFVKVLEEVLAE